MADPQKLRTRQKFVRASCCCAMGRLCWQWFICWWYLNAECSSAYQNRYLVQQQRVVFVFFSSVRYCWFSVISGKWARMNSIEHQSNHEKENVHFVVAFVVSELYCWILGICCDDCALCNRANIDFRECDNCSALRTTHLQRQPRNRLPQSINSMRYEQQPASTTHTKQEQQNPFH